MWGFAGPVSAHVDYVTHGGEPVEPLRFVLGVLAEPFYAVLLSGGRPSANHILAAVADADGTLYGRPDPINRVAAALDRWLDPYEPFVATVVRVGLGLNFAYLGLTPAAGDAVTGRPARDERPPGRYAEVEAAAPEGPVHGTP